VSFPFGDMLLGRELMKVQEDASVRRLGDLVRTARARLMRPEADEKFVQRSVRTAGLLGLDKEKQDLLRRYTSDLYHVLGDPALALPVRGAITVEVEGKPALDRPLRLGVRCAEGPAEVVLELCRDRGVAKDDVLLRTTLALQRGSGTAEIAWPPGMPAGHAIVRASARAEKRFWCGGTRFWIAR
jgi:hypothetical protein